MKSSSPSIKSSSAKGIGAIKSATRNISGNLRSGDKVSFMSVSKNSADAEAKDENGNPINKSSQDSNSDKGDYAKERQQNFVSRLTQAEDKLAFSQAMRLGTRGAPVGTASSSGGISPVLSSGSWGGTGAVAAGIGNDSLLGDERWTDGDGGYIGGTATLDKADLDLLGGGEGDGNFSVINSTISSAVSWMTGNGNYLTQHLLDQVVNVGKSLGEVFNEVHGRNVGGNSQTLNINGNKLDESFGKDGHKASHAIFLADLRHNRHGHMFQADYDNFKKVALASGVPEENIKVYDNWADYKTAMIKAAGEADAIKARDGANAQLGLLTGTAAHGYSYGGRGKHDPNAISGFSVRGQDIKEPMIERLIGLVDAHFSTEDHANNTVMINCPCHSGGFDGKTDLKEKGLLDDPNGLSEVERTV